MLAAVSVSTPLKGLHCGKPQGSEGATLSTFQKAKISTNPLLFGRGKDALRQHYVGRRRALGMSPFGFRARLPAHPLGSQPSSRKSLRGIRFAKLDFENTPRADTFTVT